MRSRKRHRKPVLFWQAVLILLPVVVLAIVGFISLRQDRLIARREAADRAQAVADDLLLKLWTAFTNSNAAGTNEGHSFQIDSSEHLLFPQALEPAPTPQPFAQAELTPEQRRLWQSALATEVDDPAAATKCYRDFISSKPPDDFAAAAHYALGLVLLKEKPSVPGGRDSAAPGQEFYQVLEKYPHAKSESGIPLRPLAELRSFEILGPDVFSAIRRIDRVSSGTSVDPGPSKRNPFEISTNVNPGIPLITVDSICSNAVYHPTPLTAHLLNKVSEILERAVGGADPDPQKRKLLLQEPQFNIERWMQLWAQHEISRELYCAARPHLTNRTGAFWFDADAGSLHEESSKAPSDDTKWLAFRREAISSVVSNRPHIADESKVLTPLASSLDPALSKARTSLTSQDASRVASNSPATSWIACYTKAALVGIIDSCLDPNRLPDYLGVGFEIAGRPLSRPGSDLRLWHEVGYISRRGGGVKKEKLPELATEILASAAQTESGADLLKVTVYLTSPTDLFKRQRTRTFWFGSLISASSLTALFGLFGAWRAFSRQQQLTEMKSNFVSSVSHELRAPIASVRLLAESLERGSVSDSGKQNQYYRFIGQECRRLSSLIENVLDFSRIEQGRKGYELEPADLVALTKQTVTLMKSYAAEKEVSIALDLSRLQPAGRPLELVLDGQAIQQALINLIDNALKHSARGQTITVGLEALPPGDDKETESNGKKPQPVANLYVEDHGPGIPPEEHEKIFERFYRLGSELRRETQGIGIGLSIVKHVVEAHGGRVMVRSAPGQGSRFTIELPAAVEKTV